MSIQMVTPLKESNNTETTNKKSSDVAGGDQFDPSQWTFGNNSNLPGAGVNRTNGTKNATTSSQGHTLDDDVQARYDLLVKSGATAISSDMLFGREEQAK